MEKILLVGFAETEESLQKALTETAGQAVQLAKSLGCSWEIGLIGKEITVCANHLANAGASKIYGIEGEDFANARYAGDLLAAEAIAKKCQPTCILMPGTTRANRILSALSVRLGGRADTHITKIIVKEGNILINRWFYRQRMEAAFTRPQRPWIIGLEPGSNPVENFAEGTAEIEKLALSLPDNARRTRVLGAKYLAGNTQTIRPDAKLLFVAGAGWTKKQADGQTHLPEAEKLILGFLDKTQASLGSSKSLVDMSGDGNAVLSFMTHLNQIGQTGSTPRHAKGLSTCCHGEEPHVVGWRFINERRAINTDANCGWARGKADVLYIADAFAVMAKVNEKLG